MSGDRLTEVRERHALALSECRCETFCADRPSQPWPTPWGVEDDIKGDGHWDNEFHVNTEDGEGTNLATFQYRNHAEAFAAYPDDLGWLLTELDAVSAERDVYAQALRHVDEFGCWDATACEVVRVAIEAARAALSSGEADHGE